MPIAWAYLKSTVTLASQIALARGTHNLTVALDNSSKLSPCPSSERHTQRMFYSKKLLSLQNYH